MDCDQASVTDTQGGSSSITTKKKQVGNVKPVPIRVANNTQELRMMVSNQVHSPSPLGHITQNGLMIYPPTHYTSIST